MYGKLLQENLGLCFRDLDGKPTYRSLKAGHGLQIFGRLQRSGRHSSEIGNLGFDQLFSTIKSTQICFQAGKAGAWGLTLSSALESDIPQFRGLAEPAYIAASH